MEPPWSCLSGKRTTGQVVGPEGDLESICGAAKTQSPHENIWKARWWLVCPLISHPTTALCMSTQIPFCPLTTLTMLFPQESVIVPGYLFRGQEGFVAREEVDRCQRPRILGFCIHDTQRNSGGGWDVGERSPARALSPTLPFPLGSQIAATHSAH